ncbi:MAG: ATP-binding cassette domain-containing protein, partial [Alicyclobacillus sp.]|nr:ATP-binding cassette domain-containing protein [Alicyclobacillus sp.]
LEAPSAGRVVIGEEAGGVMPPAKERPGDIAAHAGIRIMFQEARLLPWKRVLDNVRLAVRRPDGERVALAALGAVGLADKARAWPHTLSGGQRQRVALARAMASQPRLLLLDEPFGALDALTRLEMQQWVERVWQGYGFTALLVTHDVAEAVALADRIVMLDEGRIAMQREVRLPRPRVKDAAFFRIQQEVLATVMSSRSGSSPVTSAVGQRLRDQPPQSLEVIPSIKN